uniref:Uncharacterized protein n=1 Tax=Knipowitschia caucasica TaxID=637954 RepID=A0AAV2KZQ6_KNICA
MSIKDVEQEWLRSVKLQVFALCILLCHAPCNGLNCSKATQPALLSALEPVFNLNAIRPVMDMDTPTNVTIYFTLYGILGVVSRLHMS